MSIPEGQLATWANAAPITGASATYNEVKGTLLAMPIPSSSYDVYLQGSYGCTTNVRGDSDVDLVAQYNLTMTHEGPTTDTFTAASYLWEDFQRDVILTLRSRFGSSTVVPGKKCVRVLKGATPLQADILVALQHRHYFAGTQLQEGVSFCTVPDKRFVVNWPKQHRLNAEKKHGATNEWFKPAARMFKNARSYLIEHREIPDESPSYFVQCLIFNASNAAFGTNFQDTSRARCSRC